MTNAEYAAGLRVLADFYDAHPDTYQPYESHKLDFNMTCEGRVGVESVIRDFGGKWTKRDSDFGLMYFDSTFGPFALHLYIEKTEICERVQVGVKTIPAEPERFVPAKPERIEPQYEWHCGKILQEAERVEA